MADIVIRSLTPADAPANRRLMEQAFGKGSLIDPNEPVPEDYGKNVLGAFEDDRLQASVNIRPFVVHWAGSVEGKLPMGGIAGVATHNEARGRGHIDRLLREALVKMRADGQVISSLYPFAWAFYRKFGWDWVGEKRSITLPLREIKATPEGKFVRDITDAGAQEIITPIYEAYAQKYRGMFDTESHQWSSALGHSDNRTTYVYAYYPNGGDTATAYLLWRYHENGVVRDFVATTPDGYRALFGFLHYLGTQCETARLTAPADNPIWLHLMHWGMKTELAPVFQARVVDVCAAMQQLHAPAGVSESSEITLQIHDDAAPWNNGILRIAVESAQIVCSPVVTDSVPDVTMDIQAFSQAFWGMPDLSQLRDAGRLEINNEAGYETLARLLPASPVWTKDDF